MKSGPPNVRLADISSHAFGSVAGNGPVILLPLGSHEDHGPQQPMGDYVLADMFAERIAIGCTAGGVTAFVAPSLPFGVADYFGSSPGGLALAPETFRHVLTDILEGLLRHGLSKIIILNAHGGNAPIIHEVALKVRHERGVVIPSFYLWKIARQLLEQRIDASSGRFGHGREPLLSLNLALRPSCVGVDEPQPKVQAKLFGLPVSGFGTVDFKGLTIDAPVEFGEVDGASAALAWRARNSALGHEVGDALVSAGVDFIIHYYANSH